MARCGYARVSSPDQDLDGQLGKLLKRMSAARRQDTAFLPAALEIIETPASPIGRAVMATIAGFV